MADDRRRQKLDEILNAEKKNLNDLENLARQRIGRKYSTDAEMLSQEQENIKVLLGYLSQGSGVGLKCIDEASLAELVIQNKDADFSFDDNFAGIIAEPGLFCSDRRFYVVNRRSSGNSSTTVKLRRFFRSNRKEESMSDAQFKKDYPLLADKVGGRYGSFTYLADLSKDYAVYLDNRRRERLYNAFDSCNSKVHAQTKNHKRPDSRDSQDIFADLIASLEQGRKPKDSHVADQIRLALKTRLEKISGKLTALLPDYTIKMQSLIKDEIEPAKRRIDFLEKMIGFEDEMPAIKARHVNCFETEVFMSLWLGDSPVYQLTDKKLDFAYAKANGNKTSPKVRLEINSEPLARRLPSDRHSLAVMYNGLKDGDFVTKHGYVLNDSQRKAAEYVFEQARLGKEIYRQAPEDIGIYRQENPERATSSTTEQKKINPRTWGQEMLWGLCPADWTPGGIFADSTSDIAFHFETGSESLTFIEEGREAAATYVVRTKDFFSSVHGRMAKQELRQMPGFVGRIYHNTKSQWISAVLDYLGLE